MVLFTSVEKANIYFILFITMQRVVITGVGCISPLGVGMEHCFHELIAGKSGIVVCLLHFI